MPIRGKKVRSSSPRDRVGPKPAALAPLRQDRTSPARCSVLAKSWGLTEIRSPEPNSAERSEYYKACKYKDEQSRIVWLLTSTTFNPKYHSDGGCLPSRIGIGKVLLCPPKVYRKNFDFPDTESNASTLKTSAFSPQSDCNRHFHHTVL